MASRQIPDVTSRAIGDLIRTARKEAGHSQEGLANLLGRRQATISGWERGKTLPGLQDLYDLAFVLDKDVYELLPRRRMEPPLKGLRRAIDAQVPRGTRFHAALELFVRRAGSLPAAPREIGFTGDDPLQAAAHLLEASRTRRPPVDVLQIARRCGVRAVDWLGMDEAISGVVVELDEGPLIAVNGNHPRQRQRFTVAHELGHLALGHLKDFHVDLANRDRVGATAGYKPAQEKAANSFAANLLMPEEWVRGRFLKEVSIEDLAAVFEVSDLAMGYRLMALGLSSESDANAGENGTIR